MVKLYSHLVAVTDIDLAERGPHRSIAHPCKNHHGEEESHIAPLPHLGPGVKLLITMGFPMVSGPSH